MTLDELLELYKAFYYLPDTGHIETVLGAVAANLGSGDPVWPLLVASSSWGKTEPLNSVAGLPYVYPVSTLTEASLLQSLG